MTVGRRRRAMLVHDDDDDDDLASRELSSNGDSYCVCEERNTVRIERVCVCLIEKKASRREHE